jgi:hypothetical protein
MLVVGGLDCNGQPLVVKHADSCGEAQSYV